MNPTIEKLVKKKRRRDVLRIRLLKLMLQYYVHEDAGKLEKHERVVKKLHKAIKRVS
jgi:hypothetical protein